jgi:hypothetical protein
LSDTESIGLKRLVGSYGEASAFGFATLGYFAFATQLWLDGVYATRSAFVALLSFIALVFSTSTTAYVGASLFLAFVFLRCCWHIGIGRISRPAAIFVLFAPIMLSVLVILVVLTPSLNEYAHEALRTIFWDKLSSSSGVERSAWNANGLRNFYDSYGLGVGVGSLRASSLPVAVLASIGAPGAMFYLAFVFRMLRSSNSARQRGDPAGVAVQRAARAACVALLMAMAFTSAFVDLGLQFFILAALACAEPELGRRPSVSASVAWAPAR